MSHIVTGRPPTAQGPRTHRPGPKVPNCSASVVGVTPPDAAVDLDAIEADLDAIEAQLARLDDPPQADQ